MDGILSWDLLEKYTVQFIAATKQFIVNRFQISMDNEISEHKEIVAVMVTPDNKYIVYTWHRWVSNLSPFAKTFH